MNLTNDEARIAHRAIEDKDGFKEWLRGHGAAGLEELLKDYEARMEQSGRLRFVEPWVYRVLEDLPLDNIDLPDAVDHIARVVEPQDFPKWVQECKEVALEEANPYASRGVPHPGTGAR